MGNNLLMRMKDRFVGTLAVYAQAECTLGFELDRARAAEEISKQIATTYMSLVQMDRTQPFVLEAMREIAMVVVAAADLDRDPWDICRSEGVRIRAAYGFARIMEKKAGDRHKFTVWSGSILGVVGMGNRGVPCIVAAPSAKKAVEYLNTAVPHARETLSWFSQHWSGGGNTGEALATKRGVWIGKKKGSTDVIDGYRLAWEPKS